MSAGSLRDAYRAFTTTCALITVNGPRGPNVMAAEWTFNVSYEPFLILVSIDPANTTHDMILESGEFGVNLVSEEQLTLMGFAGHYSKADTDKLSSRAFETYPARSIRTPMIQGSLLNAECRLIGHYTMGDHTAFLGEVLEFAVDPESAPVVLHHGSHRLGERIPRSPGIVVAVTPMETGPGSELLIDGELTANEQALAEIDIAVLDAQGAEVGRARAHASNGRSFHAALRMPVTAVPGPYTVLARAHDLEGAARLSLIAAPETGRTP